MKIKAQRELEGGVETEIGRLIDRMRRKQLRYREQSHRDGGDDDEERGECRGMERAAGRDGEG